jgi:hypothetical protein
LDVGRTITTPPRTLELPEQIEVTREGAQIVMVRKWRDYRGTIPGLIAAFIGWKITDGFFLSFPSMDRALQSMVNWFPVTVLVFLAFMISAIWVLYVCVAGLFNHTRITLSPDGLLVRHGPLPWPGNVRLERASLKQFHVKTNFDRGVLSNYRIQALLRDGTLVNAVNGSGISKEQGAYIQSALRQAFRLTDTNPRDAIIADAGMTIRQSGSNLEIEKRWFGRSTVRNTVFSVIWLGFIGGMMWSWHMRPGGSPSASLYPDLPDLALLFQLPLLGFGVVFAYRNVADWLNRTFVTVSGESLTIRHGPLPWRRGIVIAIADIQQFQVKKSSLVRRGRGPGQYVDTFEVHAVLRDGRSNMLVTGFDMPNQAQQLKQEIENYLALKKVVASGLALVEDDGIQEAWENEMLHGQPDDIPMAGMSERKRQILARGMAAFLGLLAISGGVFLLTYAWGLHQSGATVLNQAIGGLVAFVPLSIGFIFVAASLNVSNPIFWRNMFLVTFLIVLLLFLLLFIRGR